MTDQPATRTEPYLSPAGSLFVPLTLHPPYLNEPDRLDMHAIFYPKFSTEYEITMSNERGSHFTLTLDETRQLAVVLAKVIAST
jgi:hypothetical protein